MDDIEIKEFVDSLVKQFKKAFADQTPVPEIIGFSFQGTNNYSVNINITYQAGHPDVFFKFYTDSNALDVLKLSTHRFGSVTSFLYGTKKKTFHVSALDELVKFVESEYNRKKERHQKKQKISARKTEIGRFTGDDGETIQSAKFEVYLNADQEINVADVQLTGTVKFFRKASRPCSFDIDTKRILSTKGEEIKAKNVDVVIEELIKCLANRKE